MAHHKSSKKRIRQSEIRRVENRYHARTMRNSLKKLCNTSEKTEAEELAPKVFSMLDKLAKKNVIHKNKAGNLKSNISKHIASLS
jgi:small subunit ribosomal protein S20